GQDLEDDPEVGPDDGADQELRRQPVDVDLPAGRLDALADEDDRQRVRDRPDEEGELPPGVALDQVPVALDDPREADQLVPDACGERGHQANTSRSASSSSSSNVRPVAAKNASSSVATPKRSFTCSTGSRKSSSPRSRIPIRSASSSASAMSCVQSRIVESCWARISRMNSCTS